MDDIILWQGTVPGSGRCNGSPYGILWPGWPTTAWLCRPRLPSVSSCAWGAWPEQSSEYTGNVNIVTRARTVLNLPVGTDVQELDALACRGSFTFYRSIRRSARRCSSWIEQAQVGPWTLFPSSHRSVLREGESWVFYAVCRPQTATGPLYRQGPWLVGTAASKQTHMAHAMGNIIFRNSYRTTPQKLTTQTPNFGETQSVKPYELNPVTHNPKSLNLGHRDLY